VRALGRLVHRHQPICRNGVCLALDTQRFDRNRFDGAADEFQGGFAEKNFIGIGGLLKPRGDVDSVASRQALRRPHEDLARVDADSAAHGERRKRCAHLGGGADGSQRVVLVHRGDAEDGHDGIADELFDGTAVRLDDCLHLLEVTSQKGLQHLRVTVLAERRRTDDVTEHDRDDLPVHPRIIDVSTVGGGILPLAVAGSSEAASLAPLLALVAACFALARI
jgi:hypothetical protein